MSTYFFPTSLKEKLFHINFLSLKDCTFLNAVGFSQRRQEKSKKNKYRNFHQSSFSLWSQWGIKIKPWEKDLKYILMC